MLDTDGLEVGYHHKQNGASRLLAYETDTAEKRTAFGSPRADVSSLLCVGLSWLGSFLSLLARSDFAEVDQIVLVPQFLR